MPGRPMLAAILEEAVSLHAPSPEERLQIVLRTTKRTAKGPREAKAVALITHLLSGTHLHCRFIPLPCKDCNMEPEILDLMDTICDAVSYASLSIHEELCLEQDLWMWT